MTSEIFQLREKRTSLHIKSKKEPFNTDLQKKYKSFRNFVTTKIRNAKSEYYKNQFSNCKSNQNEKWRFVNTILNRNAQSENHVILRDKSGSICENQHINADIFNKFFTKVGTDLANALPPSKNSLEYYFENASWQINTHFDFNEIEATDILKVIDSFSIRKATGPDGIPMRSIKDSKHVIIPVLVYLTNLIIKSSVFPNCLKIARVKPLFKKGDRYICTNYRPISVLSSISKIIEKLLSFQIRDYFETNSLLTDCQFGFRTKRSTTDAINYIMERLYQNFNSRKITQGVFLDFSKAFDTINHEILVTKLSSFYGFSMSAKELIQSYLTNRKQFVRLSNADSEMENIEIGVPQGSVLGPLLFIVYINDLLNSAPNLSYVLFADDTNVFSTDSHQMKYQISLINEWCISNRLVINYDKTHQMLFKAPNKKFEPRDFELTMGSSILHIKDETKFLGVKIDANINFKPHLRGLSKTLNLNIFMLRAVRPFLDTKSMVDLYYSFIYPHLIYGIEFWGHSSKTNLKPIKVLQKAALRVIVGVKPGKHVTSHFKKLKIMPLKMLFNFRLLKLFLKTYGKDEIDNMVPSHNYDTRKKSLKTIQANNSRGERSLLCTGVKLYNKYLLEGWAGSGCDPTTGLAERLWAHGIQ